MSRIVIVKEPGILREGVMKVLQDKLPNHTFEVYSSTQQYLLDKEGCLANLVIMDAARPKDVTNLTAYSSVPNRKIVAWISEIDSDHLTELFKLELQGYLYNGMGTSELLFAIKRMLSGKKYIHPDLVPILLNDYLKVTGKKLNRPPILTEREWDVLEQIVEGKSNESIALNLFISSTTVKNHIRSIFGKLHVTDRTNAALLAIKNNWIEL